MGLLEQLPPPPKGKTGWPWTVESDINLLGLAGDGKEWPKISIVTPSFNQGEFIEETIRSVLLQNYPNLEYSVIDGGSSDDSVSVIRKYNPWISYWVSEKDKGQSHAINKGLKKAEGEILAWLNSDDLLCANTLYKVASKITLNKKTWLVGASEIVDISRKHLYLRQFYRTQHSYELFINWSNLWFPQQSTFWTREMSNSVGLLNESLHYVMDVDYWFKFMLKASPVVIEDVLAISRSHKNAKTIADRNTSQKELIQWVNQNIFVQNQDLDEKVGFILFELRKLQVECQKFENIKTHVFLGRVLKLWKFLINPNLKI